MSAAKGRVAYQLGRRFGQGKALGDVAQVEVLDVEDVLGRGAVRGIGSHERPVGTRGQTVEIALLRVHKSESVRALDGKYYTACSR